MGGSSMRLAALGIASYELPSRRTLQNTCLEPVDTSHVWSGDGPERHFVFRYTLGINGDTSSIGSADVVLFSAPDGVDVRVTSVIGGFGAWAVRDAFNSRGRVVVHLGNAPPGPPTAEVVTSAASFSNRVGSAGAAAGAAAAAEWVRTHGSDRTPQIPEISAAEYARSHFLAASPASRDTAHDSARAAPTHSPTSSQGRAELTDYQQHGRQQQPQHGQQHGRRATRWDPAFGVVSSTLGHTNRPVLPPPTLPPAGPPPAGIALELQGTLRGEGLDLALSTHSGSRLALLLLPRCETPEQYAFYLGKLRMADKPQAPPPPHPPAPRPPVGFPSPPPRLGTYSYDRTDESDGSEVFQESSTYYDEDLARGGGQEHAALEKSLSQLLFEEEVEEQRRVKSLPPPPPEQQQQQQHTLHLSLSSVHDEDAELMARLALLAPRATVGDANKASNETVDQRFTLSKLLAMGLVGFSLLAVGIIYALRGNSWARHGPLALQQQQQVDPEQVDEISIFGQVNSRTTNNSRRKSRRGISAWADRLEEHGMCRSLLGVHSRAGGADDSDDWDGEQARTVVSVTPSRGPTAARELGMD